LSRWFLPNDYSKKSELSTADLSDLPEFAPVPRSALGPAVKEHGYYVGRVEMKAIDAVNPRHYSAHYRERKWAAAKGHLDETTRLTAKPVIEKYKGVLASADIFSESTAFWVTESIRLDLGYGSQVHP
jgi:hypothetical protein